MDEISFKRWPVSGIVWKDNGPQMREAGGDGGFGVGGHAEMSQSSRP